MNISFPSKNYITTVVVVGLLLAGSVSVAFAMDGGNTASSTASPVQPTPMRAMERHEMESSHSGRPELKLKLQDMRAEIKQRLDANKAKMCEERKERIDSHAQQATKQVTNVIAKFDSIVTKVEQFKTNKHITVANYDALVADVAAKKAKVQADLTTATIQAKAFNCTSDGPKAQLHNFTMSMQQVRQDLKDYRTAVRNLIQAVRQANGHNRQSTGSATPSGTAKPTETK